MAIPHPDDFHEHRPEELEDWQVMYDPEGSDKAFPVADTEGGDRVVMIMTDTNERRARLIPVIKSEGGPMPDKGINMSFDEDEEAVIKGVWGFVKAHHEDRLEDYQ